MLEILRLKFVISKYDCLFDVYLLRSSATTKTIENEFLDVTPEEISWTTSLAIVCTTLYESMSI